MENTCRGALFGKVVNPQSAILSKKCASLHISLIGLCTFQEYLLQNSLQRKKVTTSKFTVCYIPIHFQPLQLFRLND